MAERLMSLYLAFERKHRWGDATELRRQLDFAWAELDQPTTAILSGVLRRLEALMPSGERFDSPDSTYAQDVVVCVDAALRSLIPTEVLAGDWIEYAVEPVKTRISIQNTGFASVEGTAAVEWEMQLMRDPEIVEFLGDCETLLSRLQAAGVGLKASQLRNEAHTNRVASDLYIAS
jgi:uncharacterized protein YjaG (DUF416 family)